MTNHWYPGEEEVSNPCWCCGQECMFCLPGEQLPEEEHVCYSERQQKFIHWCSLCKYTGCPQCR